MGGPFGDDDDDDDDHDMFLIVSLEYTLFHISAAQNSRDFLFFSCFQYCF